MPTHRWKDLNHKSSPEEREQIKREAIAELDRIGFAALRKAREQTQAEVAKVLGIDQGSVSAIESRSDLLLSTLTKYVRALGGEIEIRAVFPEASFNLEPWPAAEASLIPAATNKSKHTPVSSKTVTMTNTRVAAARDTAQSAVHSFKETAGTSLAKPSEANRAAARAATTRGRGSAQA